MAQRQAASLEFLIIAANARFIACSAAACGYVPSVIDGFADPEVRSLSRVAVRVPLNGGGLSVRHVRAACERLFRERRFAGVVFGSGLDAHPAFIDWLHARSTVYANDAEVFSRCLDRSRLVGELDRLGIPHPREGRDAGSPTLLKVTGACGGAHVRFGSGAAAAYRQSYLPGTVRSYLFLAHAGSVRGVGWNTQWQSRHDGNRPFCYGGALNRSVSDAAVKARVEGYARRLARAFSLVGMNNLDYVVVGGEACLLELNPRISATMQLYDTDGALFAAHLAACRSHRFPSLPPAAPRAHAVLHASRSIRLTGDFEWPANACDLPGETCFAAGDPICTLFASAPTPAETLTDLQRSIRSLNTRLIAAGRTGASGAFRAAVGAVA